MSETGSDSDPSLLRHYGEARRNAPRPRRTLRALAVAAALALVALAVLAVVRRDSDWKRKTAFPLERCKVGGSIPARCGRLVVPENRRDPSGRRISLRVVVIPSPKQPADGALFYLEGGPGGAATEFVGDVNNTFAKVNARRDLVLVDQRGTGGSHKLACPQKHVRIDDSAAVAAYVRRCFARLAGDPRFYTTAVAMDDLDAVRRALGYGRIDVYGGSYGATAAQIYLRRHGESVRTLVIGSASLLNVPLYERSARNGERALRAQLARCAAEPACRRAFPNTRAELAALLARPPRRVQVPSVGPVVLDADDVASTIQALSRAPEGVARIPKLVHEAVGGDYAPLGEEYVTRVGAELDERSRLAMFYSILCNEPWARFDVPATIRSSAASYLEHVTVSHARLFRRVCASVPKGVVPPGSGDPPRSRVPVLILAGSDDPQDPVSNLRGWRSAFPNGRLVVALGLGHGAIEYGCLPLLVAQFVERGNARGLDASCVREIPLPPFETDG